MVSEKKRYFSTIELTRFSEAAETAVLGCVAPIAPSAGLRFGAAPTTTGTRRARPGISQPGGCPPIHALLFGRHGRRPATPSATGRALSEPLRTLRQNHLDIALIIHVNVTTHSGKVRVSRKKPLKKTWPMQANQTMPRDHSRQHHVIVRSIEKTLAGFAIAPRKIAPKKKPRPMPRLFSDPPRNWGQISSARPPGRRTCS